MAVKLSARAKRAMLKAVQAKPAQAVDTGTIPYEAQQAFIIKRLEENVQHLYQIVNRANLNGPSPAKCDKEEPYHIDTLLGAGGASRGPGINGASPAKAPHEGEIGRVYQELQPAQEITHNLIDAIQQRLDQILVPQPPNTANSTATPSLQSGVANGLQMRLDNQRSINQRLSDLLSRIAL